MSGMAHVPIRKLSAPMMKKLPMAAIRNRAKFSFEGRRQDWEEKSDDDDRWRGEQDEAKRGFTHGAREPHALHGDGLDQVHGDLAFDHFVGHLLVNRIPIEGTENPARADVGENLRKRKSRDGAGGVGEDRAPDEVVDRDVDEIRDDSRVVAQAKRQNVDEADANEFGINLQTCERRGLANGKRKCLRGGHSLFLVRHRSAVTFCTRGLESSLLRRSRCA